MAKPRTQGNGQIVPRASQSDRGNGEEANDVRSLIKRSSKALSMALPKHVTPERIMRVAMTAITMNPQLAECTPGSFMACLLTAAQLGLEVNTPLGQAYLIPRNMKIKGTNQWVKTCTFQTGYQGLIDLAYRSNKVTGIDAEVVRDGDKFYWCKGLNPRLDHEPSDDPEREQRPITHAYAVVRIRNADPRFEVLSFAQIEARRKRGDAEKQGSFSPWKTDYAEMAKKTAIRTALKYAPKSAELIQAESLEAVGEGHAQLSVAVDDRVAHALASEGIQITDVIDAPSPEADDAYDGPPDDYQSPDDHPEPGSDG
jgi:recombination protein RecT